MHQYLSSTLVAALLATSANARTLPAGWKWYGSGRGGFELCYPTFMKWQGDGEDRMSTAFVAPDGARIDADGYYQEGSLEDVLSIYTRDSHHKPLPISRKVRGKNWISAYGKSEKIEFYVELIRIKDHTAAMSVNYNPKKHSLYIPILRTLNKCFHSVEPSF